MTNLQIEQIEKYHSGQMSESEVAAFEKQLQSDPALKAENDLQSDIINGLKEHRRLELKARLDAINVGPTWVEFMGQSALVKSMGGVVIASLIGTGIYFLGERNESPNTQTPIEITAPINESVEFVWELGKEEETPANPLEQIVSNEKPISSDAPIESVIESQSAKEEEQKVAIFTPSVNAPIAEDIESDTRFEASGLDELPETSESVASEQPIDVETENSRSNTIKYKYFDGKLFLNGDFDKAPYEILEINSASGRRIYVYYLDTYYKVGITNKLTELPQVEDEEVIKELELLRENK